MTEIINHATLVKKLLQDIVSQDAFAHDQADLEGNWVKYIAFQVRFWAKQSADNTFLENGWK